MKSLLTLLSLSDTVILAWIMMNQLKSLPLLDQINKHLEKFQQVKDNNEILTLA